MDLEPVWTFRLEQVANLALEDFADIYQRLFAQYAESFPGYVTPGEQLLPVESPTGVDMFF